MFIIRIVNKILDKLKKILPEKNENQTQSESDTVILCPYCMGIISPDRRICHHCHKDTIYDAAFEMTRDEYAKAERIRCLNCGDHILKNAKFCPTCGKEMQW